ncbi:DNA polymerase III subunit epsilon [Advenella sp. S44]|uniref:3'-5' exonuclease n=1 Tax=Advenella sp. S44 TaxID=1982755 RepID=UPI000C2A9292|nr:3'-5' exonuclease [Advenella sp. S44]PJX26200.1 DNA polymerase III subunit epsilon [Advenella sp. S44]
MNVLDLFRAGQRHPRPRCLDERFNAWRTLPRADGKQNIRDSRIVVLDVETSGLDLKKDTLIAIGAVAIEQGRIMLDDAFEIVLRQQQSSSKSNILVHGIAGAKQRSGIDPAEALMQFLEYIGAAPLVAFHVAFDQTMLEKSLKTWLQADLQQRLWIDLAYLAPALLREQALNYRTLDDWTHLFNIRNHHRHHAVSDALASAELFLCLNKKCEQQGWLTLNRLATAERHYRQLIGR